MEVFGNIYVENGSTLTIFSTISFGPSSSLFVESGSHLKLDGGKLTACSTKWQGVSVAGALTIGFTTQLPGMVELLNSATIEKAIVGINGTDKFSSSGLTFEYGGGIIIVDNSIIQNCDTGIKLAPYGWGSIIGTGTPDEQSVINESRIQDCTTGISSNGNIGLEITGSTFKNNYNDYDGITSSLIANENTFTSLIEIGSEFPLLPGSTFEHNNFIGEYLEVQSQSNFSPFTIVNNSFFGAGFVALGELQYEIANNDYYDSYQGNGIYNTGKYLSNFIRDNAFNNNRFANSIWGVNDVQFLTNCFENTDFTDIELYNGSSIFKIQGAQGLSASNCFEQGAQIETGTGTENFTYWTKEGYNYPQSCKHPGHGNYSIQLAQFEADNELCGTGLDVTELPAIYRDCQCYYGDDGCEDAIEAIRKEIRRLENDNSIEPLVKEWLFAKYRQCIDKLMRTLVQSSLFRGEGEQIISYLSSQPEFRYQIMAYGIMNHIQDYDASRVYLNTLTPNTQAQTDFVSTQNIYLDYITDIDGFKLSSSNELTLENAGSMENELSGYARAIYFHLTGNKIEIDLLHLDGSITPRSTGSAHLINTFPNPVGNVTFFPNPSINLIEFSINEFNPEQIYILNIIDVYGRITLSRQISSAHESIYLSQDAGIYFASILVNGRVISTQKLLKL